MPLWSCKSTGTTLSAIALTLSVINNAASLLSGVPGLKPAVEGVLSLVKVIQKVHGNTEHAIYLAEMVKNTVKQIYGSVESNPDSMNERLEWDLKTLRVTFLHIECKIEKQMNRKWYNRALKRDAMSQILDECTREFDNAQQVFLNSSMETIYDLDSKHFNLLLEAAREAGYKTRQYSSAETRAKLTAEFKRIFGPDEAPYDWQLDVTEAILLGLDAIVIAGTGAGKTMPLLLDEQRNKMILILSPLNELEKDQAERFERMGLKATPVNGETWSNALAQEIKARKHRS
ncbi:hypothetical protein WOLCODRAFT_152604 [Wolfiporia cocos MD-104 SS10]|uniref:DEAD/DEAH-box helicase domain-containing protein n=1 Tax=Wolfiporia cocos (strain MD-104) TaxID=742152 RepID=A0A2H3JK67_WOLCO|nr:hypothetical protein WOLCODRAFT_152604 [Wolfiporia cocos MD-104 SS10]